MKSPPAFQLYVDNFIEGTVDLSMEEVGAYIRLLCYQWSKGGCPNDPVRLARITGAVNQQGNQATNHVATTKFTVGSDGLLRNDRLEQVRDKNTAWREKSSKAGKASAAQRVGNENSDNPSTTPPTKVQPTPQPTGQPNGNSPSPSPSSKVYREVPLSGDKVQKEPSRKPFVRPTLQEVEFYCAKCGLPPIEAQKFYNNHESKGWRISGQPMKSWQAAFNTWKINFETGRYENSTAGRQHRHDRNFGTGVDTAANGARTVAILAAREAEEASQALLDGVGPEVAET